MAKARVDGALPLATSNWVLKPARLYDGQSILTGVAVEIAAGQIVALHPGDSCPKGLPVHATDALVAPGFVDVQVNGGGGVLFNAAPTPEGMRAIAAAHRVSGTTACLVTVITDTSEVIERAADAAIASFGRNGIAGLHIEGPHLSQKRRGTHRADLVRPWNDATFTVVDRVCRAGVPLLYTLAPEVVPAGVITRLTSLGAVVSLGHSAASPETARRAIAEGARAATHLFNGMEPIASREPGLVGTVILSDLYAGFIADGHHVHPDMLAIAARARPLRGRMVLVSDAMPTVNGPPSFDLQGQIIAVKDGKLVNAEGSLAGVHATMASSVELLRRHDVMPIADILDAAIAAPCRMMGLGASLGQIAPGRAADMVLLDPESLALRTVLVNGRPIA
jgi:N-acetylglucosamine-6-phosphate deacetylase